MPPDECRSEGTPSLSEGPDAWGETFASFGLGRHSGVCQRESAVRAKPSAAVTSAMDMYSISQSHVGYQAAIAGRPAPTGIGGIRKNEVVCQAAFASKPAPTVDRVNLKDHVRLKAAFAGKPRSYRGMRTAMRPSVSSPALDLDPPAPSEG